jgi:hypothetical protein
VLLTQESLAALAAGGGSPRAPGAPSLRSSDTAAGVQLAASPRSSSCSELGASGSPRRSRIPSATAPLVRAPPAAPPALRPSAAYSSSSSSSS